MEIPRPSSTRPALPKPTPVVLVDVTWIVVEMEDGRYLALTPADYELLQLNVVEVLRYIREADAQLDYYRQGDG